MEILNPYSSCTNCIHFKICRKLFDAQKYARVKEFVDGIKTDPETLLKELPKKCNHYESENIE